MVAVTQFGPHWFHEAESAHLTGVTLTVKSSATLVTTYDAAGTVPTPINVRQGRVKFWAPPGTYDLHFSYSDRTDAVVHVTVAVAGSDLAGYATEAELAAKQDVVTAATDAELASEASRAAAAEVANAASIATNTAAVATKQDAATAATDAELAAATTGLPGSEIAASILTATFVVPSAFNGIPNWQVVVPANSGTVELGVPEGLLCNIVTGTNPAGTAFTLVIKITDELGAVVGLAQWAIYNSAATSQNWNNQIPLMKSVPNNPAAKTYTVQARMLNAGTLGAGANIFTAQSGFTNPTLRAVRR